MKILVHCAPQLSDVSRSMTPVRESEREKQG